MIPIMMFGTSTEIEKENYMNWNEIVKENWNVKGKPFEFLYVFFSFLFNSFLNSISMCREQFSSGTQAFKDTSNT